MQALVRRGASTLDEIPVTLYLTWEEARVGDGQTQLAAFALSRLAPIGENKAALAATASDLPTYIYSGILMDVVKWTKVSNVSS